MDLFTPPLWALASTAIVLLFSIIYWRVKKIYEFFDKRNIAGPSTTFLLGTWNYQARKFLGAEDLRNVETYGNCVGTFDGLHPNLLITDSQIIKRVLTTDRSKFRSRRALEAKHNTLKKVLEILEEDQSNDVVLLLNEVNKNINQLMPSLESSAKTLVRALLESKEVDKADAFIDDYIDNIIASTLLGLDLNENPVFRQRFVQQLKKIRPANTSSVLAVLPFLYGGSEQCTFCASTLEYFKAIIANRINDAVTKKPDIEVEKEKTTSFIDIAVAMAGEEKKLDQKEKERETDEPLEGSLVLTETLLTHVALAILVALVHYSKSALLFSIRQLGKDKEVQEKLKSEATKYLENADKVLSMEGLEKLPYLNAFVKEVHRKYPAQFRLEKVSIEDVKLSEDLEVPANTILSIPIFALHTSSLFHKEADTFSPARFLHGEQYENQHPVFDLPSGFQLIRLLCGLTTKVALLKIVSTLQLDTAEADDGPYVDGLTLLPVPSQFDVRFSTRE